MSTALQSQPYAARDYGGLRGLRGITDEQVAVHLELYRGYVRRTNALLEALAGLDPAGAPFQELKRRLGWEFDGMRLHELYFDNLAPGGRGSLEGSELGRAAAEQFGSVAAWRADFLAVAKAPGIGWAVLWLDPEADRLLNGWVGEHDCGHLAGCRPLLVLDLFEHAWSAYRKPMERAAYLDDFFANVDWTEVNRRFTA